MSHHLFHSNDSGLHYNDQDGWLTFAPFRSVLNLSFNRIDLELKLVWITGMGSTEILVSEEADGHAALNRFVAHTERR